MTRRMERVNVLLRQEISRVLAQELKDPRLSEMVSVTRVDTAPDLGTARVFISVLGDSAAKASTIKGLRSASGFVWRCLRREVNLRSVPSIDFRLDESIEQGARVLRLIEESVSGRETSQGE